MRIPFTSIALPVGFALLSAFYVILGWSHEIAGFGGDNAGYLLAAQYYSPYHSGSPLLQEYSSQIIYPPLFPWLLAVAGGGESTLVAHLVVVASALGAMVCLFFWLRRESVPDVLGGLVVLLFAAMPGTYLTSLDIWTENPYLLFGLLAILAVSSSKESAADQRWLWIALVAVAAATLVRVAALPLLAAFILYLMIHRPVRWPLFALLVALPFVLWALISAHSQVGLAAYAGHWQEKYAVDQVSLLLGQVHVESTALLDAWRFAWVGEGSTATAKMVVDAFGIVCLAGWLYRLRRLAFDALYVAIYLLMLLAWPHPEEALRYSYVLYPVLIAQAFLWLRALPGCTVGSKSYEVVAPAALATLALVMLPTLALNIGSFFEEIPPEYREAKRTQEWYRENRQAAATSAIFHTRLIGHLREVKKLVPEGECVFAIKPTIVAFYTRRSSFGPPKSTETDDDFREKMRRCKYAYLLPGASPSYSEPFYPADRLGERGFSVISISRLTADANSPIVGAVVGISPIAD